MRSNHSCLKLYLSLAFFVVCFSSLAFPQNALATLSDATCYTMTPSLTTAAYDYLDEVYTEKYPAMALRCTYGTDEDLVLTAIQRAQVDVLVTSDFALLKKATVEAHTPEDAGALFELEGQSKRTS